MAELSLGAWARKLRRTADTTEDKAAGVIRRGALNIKRDWQRLFRTIEEHHHARVFPYSVSFDEYGSGGTRWAEIGPDKSKPQGALGNLIEFGSRNNVEHNLGGGALDAEEPKFVEQMSKLAEDGL